MSNGWAALLSVNGIERGLSGCSEWKKGPGGNVLSVVFVFAMSGLCLFVTRHRFV